jgi:hypothetical protein
MAASPPGVPGTAEEIEEGDQRWSHRRTAVGAVFVLAAVAGAVVAAMKERHSFAEAYDHLGAGVLAASFACGLVGTGATFFSWDQVLRGYGVTLPRVVGFRVFFISQLGKYLPGSVWPVLMQMEAGRRHGASRRTMLGANLTTIVVGCCTGLVVACAVVPWYAPDAIRRYWWLLPAVPVLLVLLHPRALPTLLDLPFRLLKRPLMDQRLDPRNELAAAGWFLVSWVGVGAQLGVLAAGASSGHSLVSVFVLSIGAMALATTAGILFLPAPAGAGVREVVLVLVLSTIMSTGSALAVAIASRVVLLLCDFALAAVAAVSLRTRR